MKRIFRILLISAGISVSFKPFLLFDGNKLLCIIVVCLGRLFSRNTICFQVAFGYKLRGEGEMEIATLKAKEREHIAGVLSSTSWDIERSACLLQISPSQLRRKIREHGLEDYEQYKNDKNHPVS